MKEIGGYFGFEQLVSNEYHKGLIRLNTARNALLYLLKSRGIKKIYIPYYLCDSVSDMLKQNGYAFEYYNVNIEFMPLFNKKLCDDEYLYIVNYYGQITNEKILKLKQKFEQVILDNTHSFFQKPVNGVDTIYSCRKFFGVPDGAYLSTECRLDYELATDISKGRMSHILGRYEGSATDYYVDFQETDELFNHESLKYMSKLTSNLLGAIDYENVRKIRNNNYAYLENNLKEKNQLLLVAPDGAYSYPFYIKNGIEIRKELAKKKLYIPTLWPNIIENPVEESIESIESIEYQYAANILPLPVDQRYCEKDMKFIVDELNWIID